MAGPQIPGFTVWALPTTLVCLQSSPLFLPSLPFPNHTGPRLSPAEGHSFLKLPFWHCGPSVGRA